MKLNNNILILETDQKIKEQRKAHELEKKDLLEKQKKISEEKFEIAFRNCVCDSNREIKQMTHDRKGHREAHTKPGQKSIELEVEDPANDHLSSQR